jgi:oligosaccharide repeat unit polymerase
MNYTIVNTGGLIIVTLLLVWLWRRTHDLLSFANVFSVSFSLPVLGGQIWYGLIESPFVPTPDTVLLLYAGWIALLLGAAIVVRRRPRSPSAMRITLVNPSTARVAMVALMLAHLAFTIVLIYKTGLSGILSGSQLGFVDSVAVNRLDVAATRTGGSAGGGGSSVRVGWYLEAWHNAFVYYVPLALLLYRQGQISKKLLPLILAFAGISSLVMFSRVQFVMFMTFSLVTWLILFRPSARKMAFYAVAMASVAVGLFASMQSVLARLNPNPNFVLSDQLATYAFSSAPAFQELLRGRYYQFNPHNAMFLGENVYYVLGKLSLLQAEDYPGGFREYVFVPDPTNVYTFLDAFALDFGTLGIIFGPLLMGMGMAWIYNRLHARVTYSRLLLYCLCVYTCSAANLANFLHTPSVPVFLGTVFLLQPLVSARPQLRAPISRVRELISRA